MLPPPPRSTLFPYTTLFRSSVDRLPAAAAALQNERTSVRSPSAMSSDAGGSLRSEEHTSELQSPYDLVCRLLLEKKKKIRTTSYKSLNNITSILLCVVLTVC